MYIHTHTHTHIQTCSWPFNKTKWLSEVYKGFYPNLWWERKCCWAFKTVRKQIWLWFGWLPTGTGSCPAFTVYCCAEIPEPLKTKQWRSLLRARQYLAWAATHTPGCVGIHCVGQCGCIPNLNSWWPPVTTCHLEETPELKGLVENIIDPERGKMMWQHTECTLLFNFPFHWKASEKVKGSLT